MKRRRESAHGRETDSFAELQDQEYRAFPTEQGCIHEVCYPPDFEVPAEVTEVVPELPAKEYPFPLDAFQRKSVSCLEQNESVLVSAHTSAGKTVVAEYAIALSFRNKQRVIYTSPIKALSNQKYRDLSEEFEDVGLMTGDVVINPTASCLVMTTEILRNMLYRGSEMMREVAWVIFDEIHYMSNVSRGVVWEETMILLPHRVRYVFLSATIPNAREFAFWIAKLHAQPCNVVYTDKRPTPLQHYLYTTGSNGLHLVVNRESEFLENNFAKAMAAMKAPRSRDSSGQSKKELVSLVKTLFKKEYNPVIVFAFSKKMCESNASALGEEDYSGDGEKEVIQEIFTNAIQGLSDDDQKLPQVANMLPLLKKGIGIHHSGLLPIIKEVTELLFQEGLLKILFTTETFAMGLNMPARTVVFADVMKFDGKQSRLLTPGEYIQMSGRAGRRGQDAEGTVILILNESLEPSDAKQMVNGKADPLDSSFYVGYNMLLNLMRIEEVNPKFLIDRSFHQFQNARKAPEIQAELRLLEDSRDPVGHEEEVQDYVKIAEHLDKCIANAKAIQNTEVYAKPFLQTGRVLELPGGHIGIVLSYSPKGKTVDVFTEGRKTLTLPLSAMEAITSIMLKIPSSISPSDRQKLESSLSSVRRKFPDGIPVLDPQEDMHIDDERYQRIQRNIVVSKKRLASHDLVKHDQLHLIAKYREQLDLEKSITACREKLENITKNLEFQRNVESMTRVLRRLECIDEQGIIQLKGRVACEVSTCDELLAVELMFGGAFNNMTPPSVCALLSCLVFNEGAVLQFQAKDSALEQAYSTLTTAVQKVGKIKVEEGMDMDLAEYTKSFKPDLMEVVYKWCQGSKFVDVFRLCPKNVYEGSVIRAIRRLHELLMELVGAAKLMGNPPLVELFTACTTAMHRDIVFAASLYLD